jgi:archaellum biogenesis ATPase FlaH
MRAVGQVIRLSGRNSSMLKSELIAKNPLRVFDQQREGGLGPGQTGLIAARAGTGKTALLIQIALDNLFRGNPVLHVSVGETVNHIQAWYEEIFRDLAHDYDLEMARQVWEESVRNRLILTFRAGAFSSETLKERLGDLTEQGIFNPRVMVVDGLDLHREKKEAFESLRDFARQSGLKVWVAIRTHRDDGSIGDLVTPIESFFNVVLSIEATGDGIKLTAVKNPSRPESTESVTLDPKTLLLINRT